MNTITGTIVKPGTGKKIIIPPMAVESLNLELSDGTWSIGIDQSTSCTGFCFHHSENKMLLLLDLKRDRCLEDRVYFNDIFKFLRRTTAGHNFDMTIIEKPAPKDMYASRVLQELKGRLEEWVMMIPELENTLMDSIFHQVWVSHVIDKSKGKNRSNDKRCVAEDLVDGCPELQDYYDWYPYDGYDSFDAYGILKGFKKYAFTDDGAMKIHGVKEKNHVSLVGYNWVDVNNIASAVTALDGLEKVTKLTPLVFNERYKLYDNIRMATSNWTFSMCILPKKELKPFMWKYNIDVDDDSKLMVAYFVRKGEVSTSFIKYFKSCIPWNEEVYGEE